MNILLTSVGRRTYMVKYFMDALQGDGKVHSANNIMTYALQQSDKYVITPNIYDVEYIPFLLTYCKDNDISAIISLFDIDLPVLAQHKQLFQDNGVNVIVSDYDVTTICNDKWKTYKFLKEIGLLQPNTYLVLESAKKAIDANCIEYPLILKPRWGMGSIGIYKVEGDEELNVFYKRLQKEIFDTYLCYESSIDRSSCILIQEMIKGQEYGLEVLNDLQGNYVTTFAKKKIAMRSGETDVAEIVDNKPFEEITKLISKELGHIANLDMDCFLTKGGEKVILEMNCRFGGQYPFSHLAGANVPKQIVDWLKGKPTNHENVTLEIGVRGCKDLNPVVF